MDWSRKWKLIWRWSLLSSIPIALYWAIWYLTNGSIPSQASPEHSVLAAAFPYTISRWWDIAIGPIWTAAFILCASAKRMSDKKVGHAFGVGLLVGGVVSLIMIFAPWDHLSTGTISIWMAILTLAGGFLVALFNGVMVIWGAVGAALVAGAVFGLAHGILLGASCAWLVWGFGIVGVLLGAGIRRVVLTLASKATWQAVGRWLAAK